MFLLPTDISEVMYVAALAVPGALISTQTKIVQQMYRDYMEYGVHLFNGSNPAGDLKIEGTIKKAD